ncbi:septal ring lytic transglycosylase RlpA family protein [Conexibacter sp. DBS9H8]|uniref:septal ring lytic transglycosylase RlpA family protein n=1 Tax=Conexibacter sp. DBS9H8 TaxID=2937801 RepID=UPI00200C9A7C|nr:septal ring lytic transglycosylase RlpA family protein [Conexibacter sp. DBS9H8]
MTITRPCHRPGRALRAGLAAALLLVSGPATGALAATTGAGAGGSSGGAGLSGGAEPSGSTQAGSGSAAATGTPPATAPLRRPESAAGGGFRVSTVSAAALHHAVILTGTWAGAAASTVAMQVRAPQGPWQTVTETATGPGGHFRAAWRASRSGALAVRAAIIGSPGSVTAAENGGASPDLAVTVYRPAVATIYGPGFYGHRTACGQTLAPNTLGVASRTLACGTRIVIAFRGRSITVPVIDRGPYSHGASLDLTMATARALNDTETETVGAAVL